MAEIRKRRRRVHKIVRFIMSIITRTEYIGLEHVPAEGPVIIATNHLSRLDIPVLFTIPTRADMTALVTDKYQDYPLIRWFVNLVGGVWLDRTKADYTAFKQATDELIKGVALGISPEGTRSETGKLLPGKPGTALLAAKTGVLIVPVGLAGTESGVKKILRLQRPSIVARFGQGFKLESIPNDNRSETLQKYTDEIMCRIAALLPVTYRGEYSDHPRLKELLQDNLNNQG